MAHQIIRTTDSDTQNLATVSNCEELNLQHNGSIAAGFGTSLDFKLNDKLYGNLITKTTNISSGTETSEISFKLLHDDTLSERFIFSPGELVMVMIINLYFIIFQWWWWTKNIKNCF